MNDFYFGIDIGGTFVKSGIVDPNGNVLFQKKAKTDLNSFDLADIVWSLIENLSAEAKVDPNNALGLGIACAGTIDSETGVIRFSPNLKIKDYPLTTKLQKHLSIPIKVVNDAEAVVLAEQHFGAGKNCNDFLMITIGTGIGGGVVVNGKSLRANKSFACEVGHIKIAGKKIKCGCGEYNCFETLASTSALVREIKLAMQKNPESKLWTKGTTETISAVHLFELLGKDKTADLVFENYISNLGNGIVSIINILCPKKVIIGGAISKQKEKLLTPLKEYVDNHIHTKHINNKIDFCASAFNNDSGIVGSVCLFK